MNNRKIVDIYYQHLEVIDGIFTQRTQKDIDNQTKRLFNKGFEPYFPPVLGKYETNSLTYIPFHYQTWVKYEDIK